MSAGHRGTDCESRRRGGRTAVLASRQAYQLTSDSARRAILAGHNHRGRLRGELPARAAPTLVLAACLELGRDADEAVGRGGPAHHCTSVLQSVESAAGSGRVATQWVGPSQLMLAIDPTMPRAGRHRAGSGAYERARSAPVAVRRHHRGPTARDERADVVDRLRHVSQRRVARAHPVELEVEARRPARVPGAAADGERPDSLRRRATPRKAGPLRRALVAVAACNAARGAEIEGSIPGPCAVDEHVDAAPAELGDQPPSAG